MIHALCLFLFCFVFASRPKQKNQPTNLCFYNGDVHYISLLGLLLRVRFDSLQTTTTNHLYICRRFNGRYFVRCTSSIHYVAAKATYIRLLHGKIGFWGGFSALAP